MTMLDRMRRHKRWLKWTLALVVLAFVAFYVPDFLGGGITGGPAGPVADVEGREISANEFRRAYYSQLDRYRRQFGRSMNDDLLKQLGLDRQILQQLIDERVALAEAERLGITVSDAEVREFILNLPAFQRDGQFVGEAEYRRILELGTPPLTPAEFEESVRRGLTADKLRAALTEWIAITDEEVDREYRRRNEKVKVQVVSFPLDKFREGVKATDEEIAAHFKAHQEDFRIPEKRKIRFIVLDVQALRDRINVSATDVQRYYEQNQEQFSTPEQIRASHILFKTEGQDKAAVRARAEKVLAQARAGADFARLATQHSEDEASKAQGGDLGLFARGRMVPAFDQAAFALEPGQISDLVETEYGLHIIKVTAKEPPAVKPLDEVRQQITDQLKWERAQAQASRVSQQISDAIDEPADLDTAASARGLKVEESGFFERGEPISGLGPAPAVADQAFTLEQGAVSEAIRIPQGYAWITVTGTQASRLPKLEEVKDRVREAVEREKAIAAAREQAKAVAATLKSATDFGAAAKAAGLEARTSELVTRGQAFPEIGVSAEAERVAFSLPKGGVSDPIATDTGVAILKVLEREDVTPEQLAASRTGLREELLEARRGRFFGSYMQKVREKMQIRINQEALQQIVA